MTPAVRDAATVMLVRDRPAGDRVEVFMLRRNLASAFVAGAHVFPGGAVDECDRVAGLEAVCRGRSDREASARLGVERGGLAFWVAAIRECFEEAGILLACPVGTDAPISFAHPEVAERFGRHRRLVAGGERDLVEVCRLEDLELAVDGIQYLSHWVTPEGPPRRYDTRFFVAAAPPEQVALHDEGETIGSVWLSPADALARHRAGQMELVLPTIKNLETISAFTRCADLLAAAEALAEVPAIQARIVAGPGGPRVVLPGDPGYEQAGAVMTDVTGDG